MDSSFGAGLKAWWIVLCWMLLYGYALSVKFNVMPNVPWVRNYLADVLAVPLICFIALMGLRWVKKNSKLVLSKNLVFFTVVYIAVIFEYFLPKMSVRYTSDFGDVLCYGVGGIIFYVFQHYFLQPTLSSSV